MEPNMTLDQAQSAVAAKAFPKVTTDSIKAKILSSEYWQPAGTTLTVCVIHMTNGFTFVGKSGAADARNFDPEIGQRYAFEDAFKQIWSHEGYLLRNALANEGSMEEIIPRVAHEVNRAYCASLGDASQPAWEDAPEWQRQSAINGVLFHKANPEASPAASHESWLAEKERDGWRYGQVKDPEKKEHPCFLPYDQLPQEQRAKDYIFKAVVGTLLEDL